MTFALQRTSLGELGRTSLGSTSLGELGQLVGFLAPVVEQPTGGWEGFALDRVIQRIPAKELAKVKARVLRKVERLKSRPMSEPVIAALERIDVRSEVNAIAINNAVFEKMAKDEIDKAIQIELLVQEIEQEITREIKRRRRAISVLLFD